MKAMVKIQPYYDLTAVFLPLEIYHTEIKGFLSGSSNQESILRHEMSEWRAHKCASRHPAISHAGSTF